MPGFRKILKKWLLDSYDYLGLVLASSFLWFSVVVGGLAAIKVGVGGSLVLLLVSAALFYIFLIAPMTTGVHVMAKKIVTRDDPSLLDALSGFKDYLKASWALGLAQMFVTLLIVANAWFYLTRGAFVLKLLGILFVYLLLLWALSAVYHFPLLIEQRPGALKILRRGILLMLDNVAFTGGVFFVIILLTCFCAITLLGLPLLYVGMVSIVQTRALRALFVKYGILEPEREYVPEAG
ncbi:MAG TPA: hypothetical protein VMX94_01345 [Armatimonadota bacterium]|nr:hypothetical protein [Armatimonadota bacterium]